MADDYQNHLLFDFKAEISNERGRFKILRDGIELTRSDGVRIKRNEKQVRTKPSLVYEIYVFLGAVIMVVSEDFQL